MFNVKTKYLTTFKYWISEIKSSQKEEMFIILSDVNECT